MAFQESYEPKNIIETEAQVDVYEKQNEPFTPPLEGFASSEDMIKASNGASEKGSVTQKQIADLRETLIKNQFASPEKIKEVTAGMSEKGFATPEEVNAATTIALDQASNSMETTGRLNATIAMQEAEDTKKNSGFTKMLNWVRGKSSQKRQDSQNRFNKVN